MLITIIDAKADEAAGQFVERLKMATGPFVTELEASVVAEPSQAPFHHVAFAAQATAVFSPAPASRGLMPRDRTSRMIHGKP